MKTCAAIPILFLLSGCTTQCSYGVLTPEEFKAQEKEFYRNHSTPENVASDSELRDLLPPSASYYKYPWPNPQDTWLTEASLETTVDWYRTTMAGKGYKATLRQCSDGSVYGGRLLIIDYCSEDMYAMITLGDESQLKKTLISVVSDRRRPSFRCDDPNTAEYRSINTKGCPTALIP